MQFFYWFGAKQVMLDFRDHAHFLHPSRSDIDLTDIDSALGREIANADPNDLESLRKQLNERLVGSSQFTW